MSFEYFVARLLFLCLCRHVLGSFRTHFRRVVVVVVLFYDLCCLHKKLLQNLLNNFVASYKAWRTTGGGWPEGGQATVKHDKTAERNGMEQSSQQQKEATKDCT